MKENTAEKLNRIQSLFDTGKSHKEIAETLGYTDIRSFYRYIARHDASLNRKKQYSQKILQTVPKDVEADTAKDIGKAVSQPTAGTSKAETIVYMLDNGADIKEVAKRKHFKGVQELADYMKSMGYSWNNEHKNYIITNWEIPEYQQSCHELLKVESANKKERHENSCDCLEKYGALLNLLSDKQEKLVELLEEQSSTNNSLPRYPMTGIMTAKTFNMAEPLKQLIMEYAEERNVQQKDIFSIAMIDFLKKYGYMEEVKARLGI